MEAAAVQDPTFTRPTAIPRIGGMFKFILCPYQGRWPKIDCVHSEFFIEKNGEKVKLKP